MGRRNGEGRCATRRIGAGAPVRVVLSTPGFEPEIDNGSCNDQEQGNDLGWVGCRPKTGMWY